ncbi:MAG: hypothetical protein V5A88_10485, partial [Candidatus Thermoplasmatota archaeon]
NMKKMDYSKVSIPEDKDKREYDTDERRAYVFEKVIDAGHPQFINQSDLAEVFEVSATTIYNDLDAIADSIWENSGDVDLLFDTIYESVIKELREEEDYSELRKWLKDFSNYLMERGAVSRAPEKKEITRTPVEFDLTEEIEETSEEVDK